METKLRRAGLVSLGAYLPAKPIPTHKKIGFIEFLRKETLLPEEYIRMMEQSGNLPGFIETNEEGWKNQPWFEAWLERLPEKKKNDPFQGTRERRRVPLDPHSVKHSVIPHPMLPSDAETLAGALALFHSGIPKDDIDLVMVHSQVQDHSLPSNASLVQHKLQLKHAGAYAVDTCCSSFVTMVELACSLVQSGIKNNVLIINSILDSMINDKSDYYSVNTGDAATAAVITAVGDGNGYVCSHSTSDGSRQDAIIFQRRSPHLFMSTAATSDHSQDFVTFYNMEAVKEVGFHAQEDIKFVVSKVLEKSGLNIKDVYLFVTHQPVAWAAHAWKDAIGVPDSRFYESFERYGNIATASVPTNLTEAVEKGMVKAGDLVLLASSGAGENHIALLFTASQALIDNVC